MPRPRVIDQVAAFFELASTSDYIGEPVSQAEHALQCAALAARQGDDELTLAALLHDVGHLAFPDAEKMGQVGVLDHEALGADFLAALGFSPRVCRLVAGHVAAKRYLAVTRPGYLDRLSPASHETLSWQGGPMSSNEVKEFEASPDRAALTALRAFDEAAKQPGLKVPGLEAYVPAIERHLEDRQPGEATVTRFRESGFVRLPGFLGPREVDRLRSRIEWLAEHKPQPGAWMRYFEDTASGERRLGRIEDFAKESSLLGQLVDSPALIELTSRLMDSPACLFKEKVNFKRPGGGAFAPHQDAPAFTSFGHTWHITVMVALDDATPENGCLEVVPGVWDHVLATNDDLTMADSVVKELAWTPLQVRAGDLVCFHSYLPHRSANNLTRGSRRAIFATYNRASEGDVRDAYFAEKRRVFPPDDEREPGRTYEAGVFNVGNPISTATTS